MIHHSLFHDKCSEAAPFIFNPEAFYVISWGECILSIKKFGYRVNNFDIPINQQPRPSYGQNQNQSLAYGTTPSSKFCLKISYTLKLLSYKLFDLQKHQGMPDTQLQPPLKWVHLKGKYSNIISLCAELVTD